MLPLFFTIVTIEILDVTAQCSFDLNGNVSFDLSPLARSLQSYQIAHSSLLEYKFFVNFCANSHVSSIHSCNGQSTSYAYVEYHINTTDTSNDWCESVSGTTPQASLITESDPSFGIILHYSNGSTANGCDTDPRSMDIHLICDANVTDIQTTDTAYSVPYDSPCQFRIEPIHTPFACPLSCHSNSNGELCNNNGECGYDWSLKRAKCFCFHGWSGSLCDTPILTPIIMSNMYVQYITL